MEVKPCEFCEENLPVDFLREHLEECKYRPYECTLCKHLVLQGEKKVHDSICHGEVLEESYHGSAYRVTSTREEEENSWNERAQAFGATGLKVCSVCKKPLSHAEIENHENTCEMHLAPCLFCDAPIHRRNKAQHIRNSCPGCRVGAGIPDVRLRKERKQSRIIDELLEVPGKLLPQNESNIFSRCSLDSDKEELNDVCLERQSQKSSDGNVPNITKGRNMCLMYFKGRNLSKADVEPKNNIKDCQNYGNDFATRRYTSTEKETPEAQKPNSHVHNEKSFLYNDDDSVLSDDNNPENETVEHFIWKALLKAESLRKSASKSEVGI